MSRGASLNEEVRCIEGATAEEEDEGVVVVYDSDNSLEPSSLSPSPSILNEECSLAFV